jgi:hypothetical protein
MLKMRYKQPQLTLFVDMHTQAEFQLVNLPLNFRNLEIKKIKWQIDELELGHID